MQMTLVANNEGKFLDADKKRVIEDDERLKEKFSVEYCYERIAKEACLWDMRCWYKLKDRNEVKEWIQGDTKNKSKNCGHVGLLVYILRTLHNEPIDKIADAILANDIITYENDKDTGKYPDGFWCHEVSDDDDDDDDDEMEKQKD